MKKTAFIALILFSFGCKKDKPEPEPLPPVTSVGEFYQGGLVFYVDSSGQHGYIITDRDIDTCKWTNETGNESTFSQVLPEAVYAGINFSEDAGKGETYARKIVETLGAGNYAAKVCDDLQLNGYSDWWLPSSGELFMVMQSKIFPFSSAADNPAQGYYWSSREYPGTVAGKCPKAYAVRAFIWGTKPSMIDASKNATNVKVRAIRRF